MGDIHAGAVHCAENDIKQMIEKVRQDKNGFIIGMGDYADAILKDDKRFDIEGLAPWVKKDNIVECQRQWLKELFMPVKDKILCLLTGNHEETIHLHYQDDLIRNLCNDLKVPYGGYSNFTVLKFTRDKKRQKAERTYVLHCWHGSGASQTEGARIMRLMRLVNDVQADIYLMGHLHCVAHYTPDRLLYQNGRVKSRQLIAVMTGSWLKTYTQPKNGQQLNASYAEMKGYKPSRIGCPILHVRPSRDEFTVEG